MESLSEMVVNEIFAYHEILSPSPETAAGVRKVVECLVGSAPNSKYSWETEYGTTLILGEDNSLWAKSSRGSFSRLFAKINSVRRCIDTSANKTHGDFYIVRSNNRYLFFCDKTGSPYPGKVEKIAPKVTPLGVNLGINSSGEYVTWKGKLLAEDLRRPLDTEIDIHLATEGTVVFPTTVGFYAKNQDSSQVNQNSLDNLAGLDPNSLEYFSCRPRLTPLTSGYTASKPESSRQEQVTSSLVTDFYPAGLAPQEYRPALVLARTKSGDSYYAIVDTNPFSPGEAETEWIKLPNDCAFAVKGKFKRRKVEIREKINGDLELHYGKKVTFLGTGNLSEVFITQEDKFSQTLRLVIHQGNAGFQTRYLEITINADGTVDKNLLYPLEDPFLKKPVTNSQKTTDLSLSPVSMNTKEEAGKIARRLTRWPYMTGLELEVLHPIFGVASVPEDDIPVLARIWNRWSSLNEGQLRAKTTLFMGILPFTGNNIAKTTRLVDSGNFNRTSPRQSQSSTRLGKLAREALEIWKVPIPALEEKYLKQFDQDFQKIFEGAGAPEHVWEMKTSKPRAQLRKYCGTMMIDKNKNLWRLRYLDTPKLEAKNIKFRHFSYFDAILEDDSHRLYWMDLNYGIVSPIPPERRWLAGEVFCENGVYVDRKGVPYRRARKNVEVPPNLNFCPHFSGDLTVVPDANGELLWLHHGEHRATLINMQIDIESATDYTPVSRTKNTARDSDSSGTDGFEFRWFFIRNSDGKIRFYIYNRISKKGRLEATHKVSPESSPIVAIKKQKNRTLEYSRSGRLVATVNGQNKTFELASDGSELLRLAIFKNTIESLYLGEDGNVYVRELSKENELDHDSLSFIGFENWEYDWKGYINSSKETNRLTQDDLITNLSYNCGAFHRAIYASLTEKDRKIFLDFMKELRSTPTPYEYSDKEASPWAGAQRLTKDNQPSVWDSCYPAWPEFYNCLFLANGDIKAATDCVRAFMKWYVSRDGRLDGSHLFSDAARQKVWSLPEAPRAWV